MSICLEVMRCYGHQVSGYQCISVSHEFIAMSMSPQQLFLLTFIYQSGIRVGYKGGV